MIDGQPKTYEDIYGHIQSQYLGRVASIWPFFLETNLAAYIPVDVDALPQSFTDLGAFNMSKSFFILFQYLSSPAGCFGIEGEITSLDIIPEPATLLLLGLGGLTIRLKLSKSF
ncbi:MAG: hypothetical protein A2Y12_05955 [Planctomycetes bacterium GWF2_42_9]|nr:MAG: hypothetical protein A2Y12_05955 [Planctomycetes bacterium GWF2_42_9]